VDVFAPYIVDVSRYDKPAHRVYIFFQFRQGWQVEFNRIRGPGECGEAGNPGRPSFPDLGATFSQAVTLNGVTAIPRNNNDFNGAANGNFPVGGNDLSRRLPIQPPFTLE
jgi:hypothetical protein